MKLTLTATQFCQVVMCMLYDSLVHPDETAPILINQDYNDLMTLFKNRGMRTILQQYYMRLDPQMRMRYRFIEDVFKDSAKSGSAFIEIRREKVPAEKKGLVRSTGEFLLKVVTLGLYKGSK